MVAICGRMDPKKPNKYVAIDKLSTKEEQEAAHQKNRRTQFIVLSTDYSPDSEE